VFKAFAPSRSSLGGPALEKPMIHPGTAQFTKSAGLPQQCPLWVCVTLLPDGKREIIDSRP
jgi:hypothetical protein